MRSRQRFALRGRYGGSIGGTLGGPYVGSLARALVGGLVAALAACNDGNVRPELPDAPALPDGALEPDAAPGDPVKLTVLSYLGDGRPDVAARILFHDAAGEVVFEGQVDLLGRLDGLVPSGGTVTSVRIVEDTPALLRAQITSITGVAPGDELTIGVKQFPVVTNQGGQTSMNATFTRAQGAATHSFHTQCASSNIAGAGTTVTLTLRDSCHGAQFDLLAVASGGSLTTPQYIKVRDIAHQNGASFAVPGEFQDMSGFGVTALNVPDEVDVWRASRAELIGGRPVAPQQVVTNAPPAGTLNATVPYPPDVGTRAQVATSMTRADAIGTHEHAMVVNATTTAVTLDTAQLTVPWFTNPRTTPTGAAWEIRAPGDADGQVTLWSGTWIDASQREIQVAWRIAHAPNDTGVTLPRLPASLAGIDPRAQAAVTPALGAAFVTNIDVVGGYDEFRRMPDTLVTAQLANIGAFPDVAIQRRQYTVALSPMNQLGAANGAAIAPPAEPFGPFGPFGE